MGGKQVLPYFCIYFSFYISIFIIFCPFIFSSLVSSHKTSIPSSGSNTSSPVFTFSFGWGAFEDFLALSVFLTFLPTHITFSISYLWSFLHTLVLIFMYFPNFFPSICFAVSYLFSVLSFSSIPFFCDVIT